jgi:hypothetical protein
VGFALADATQLTSAYDSTDASSYTTASITPPANQLILYETSVRVGATATGNPPSLSGNGMTPTFAVEDGDTGTTANRKYLHRAMGASPSAGAVTITPAVAAGGCSWSIAAWNKVPTSGTNGSGAVRNPTGSGDTVSATSGSITLPAFLTDSAVYASFFHQANEASTHEATFTELSDVNGTSPNHGDMAEWKETADTTPSATWTTSSAWRGVACEILFAPPANKRPRRRRPLATAAHRAAEL